MRLFEVSLYKVFLETGHPISFKKSTASSREILSRFGVGDSGATCSLIMFRKRVVSSSVVVIISCSIQNRIKTLKIQQSIQNGKRSHPVLFNSNPMDGNVLLLLLFIEILC